MPLLSRLTYLGLAKEVTQGVAVAPTLFLPYTSSKPEDLPVYLDDDSMFGNPSKVRDVYQGEKNSMFDFDGPLYPESVGSLLVAAGLADTPIAFRTVADGVTTSASAAITSVTAAFIQTDVGAAIGGSANIPAGTTIISVQSATAATMSANATASGTAQTFNIGTTGQTRHRFALTLTQPPTWTITDFDSFEARAFPGQILDSVHITIDAKGMLKYAAKFKGWPSVTASTPTPTFPTSPSFLGWGVTAVIAGVAVNRIVTGSIDIKRSAEEIHTLSGTQNPYSSFAGPFDVDMKLKTLFETNAELNHMLANEAPTVVLTMTSPNAGPVLTFTATKTKWKKAPVDRGSAYMQVDSDIKPVYNTTDGGMISATLQNAQTTAY